MTSTFKFTTLDKEDILKAFFKGKKTENECTDKISEGKREF